MAKTSQYLPQLTWIDIVSWLQNRYVFVGGQKNYKRNKKLISEHVS